MTQQRDIAEPSSEQKPLSPKRRRFLKWAVGTALLGAGTTALGQDTDDLNVETHDVFVTGWPPEAVGLRVGMLSDLHCDSVRAETRTIRAAHVLLAQKPDVVFLCGDFISIKPHRWASRAAAALAPLTAAPGGVFAILGNHDWGNHEGGSRCANQVADALRQVGFRVLRNESAPLPGIPDAWVVGLDSLCVHQQNAQRALRHVPPHACKLLLMHEPDYADHAPPGFAFQFSGHSHAGQIRLPGLPPMHCPKYGRQYSEGLRQAVHHPVYTSRGVGTIGPPLRVFCPPEVTLLRLFPRKPSPPHVS